MNKKENLKVVFDFIAEYLSGEESTPATPKVEAEVKEEPKVEAKPKSKYTDEQISSAEHMLEIMKRVELRDKMLSTAMTRPNVVPIDQRDNEPLDQTAIDRTIVATHQQETQGKGLGYLKNVLTDAKVIMNELDASSPIVDSVSSSNSESDAELSEIKPGKYRVPKKR